IAVGAAGFAYLLFTRGSDDLQIFLIWALAITAVALALLIKYQATHRVLWLVLAGGLMVKLAGSMMRHWVYVEAYERNGDAGIYYGKALVIARGLWNLDPTQLFAPSGATFGTRFTSQVAGVVVSISGPSMRAAFVVFALMAFAGVLLFAAASKRIPEMRPTSYLAWLVFWPSLFFWPSSVGKEAFILFCLGLAVWGYAQLPRVAAWPALAIGLLLAGLVRPHIAAVAIAAMAVGAMLRKDQAGLTGTWYFQFLFFAGAVALTFYLSAGALGIESLESAVERVEEQAAYSDIGGSAAGTISVSPLHIPSAFIRALFRPFVWESGSAFMRLSALEAIAMVVALVWRRKQLWASLRNWRSHRLIAFCVVFVVLYALLLGFSVGNLAIIARQRTLLLPMLFLLLQGREGSPSQIARRG
ncbi:MAG: hypothetical protein GX605_11875, partial [Chloroflexi bacterium]|nr:hypothetical protein [Chloroflexota bacterium]